MASEYLKWKYRDVQPDKPLTLSKGQRWKNWWHYNKWFVIIGAVLLAITGSILWHALGIGVAKPDVQIGYVGAGPLPDETVAALESSLAQFAGDVNNDGKVVVKINQYPTDATEESADAAEYAAGSAMRLMGDLESRENYFFILDDPETFHKKYEVLADLTGAFAGSAGSVEAYRWSSCPELSGVELGSYTDTILGQTATGSSDDLLAEFYIARLGIADEEKSPKIEAYDALWKALTKGAET